MLIPCVRSPRKSRSKIALRFMVRGFVSAVQLLVTTTLTLGQCSFPTSGNGNCTAHHP